MIELENKPSGSQKDLLLVRVLPIVVVCVYECARECEDGG
jgi:hypothetical protein